MKLGLELCDAMVGLLLDDRSSGEAVIFMNGLKQKNVAGGGFFVYRQRNPQTAVEAIGITGGRVEQCMTRDSTILFDNEREAARALELLDNCYLSDGHKTFFVERQDSNRVFYQLAFEHEVARSSTIVCGNYGQPFYDVFQLVCERTGSHVPEGDIFCDGIALPEQIYNHDLYHHVVSYFLTEHTSP